MRPDPEPIVLYVDDEQVNLRVFEANFRQVFRVRLAASGPEALKLVEQSSPECAVVIADQRMPGMTGVELLERVRHHAPDTHRMLITAFADMQAVVDAVNRGQVSRYFLKPWTREELLNGIRDAVRIFSLQQRMRALELRMVRSERLATLGQVSAGVAHELLNPLAYLSQNVEWLRGQLAVLQGYTAPLLGEKPDAGVAAALAEIPAMLSDIEQGARHLRAVGDRLKEAARGGGEERCDVHDVAHFAERISRSEVRKQARLTLKGEPLPVRIKDVSLTQILLNLILNAAHALDGLGRAGLIEVRWSARDDRAVVEVEDNGAGISVEHLERVFEPLFTTHAESGGTGLGLSVCRDLIRDAGGDLKVRSTLGMGTTFTLELRRADVDGPG